MSVNRYAIVRSRIDSTRVLGAAVAACRTPPAVWLNASTATIYQDTREAQPANTEAHGQLGRDFSETVAQRWEAEFNLAHTPATRRLALRTAIVLGADGGALPVMARLARFGISTAQSSGQQWVSWLHIADFCRVVEFLVARPHLEGTFNLCAPEPLPNYALMALLDQHYHPRWHLLQPRWLLEIGAFLLGTETELILKSRKVVPARLLDAGFRFQYADCPAALGRFTAPTALTITAALYQPVVAVQRFIFAISHPFHPFQPYCHELSPPRLRRVPAPPR